MNIHTFKQIAVSGLLMLHLPIASWGAISRPSFATRAEALAPAPAADNVRRTPGLRSPKSLKVTLESDSTSPTHPRTTTPAAAPEKRPNRPISIRTIPTETISLAEIAKAAPAPILPKLTRQTQSSSSLVFDIPVAYNKDVRFWVKHFQGQGRGYFKKWLERSSRYLPNIQKTLQHEGLPKDLAYMAMIESGFSSAAVSTAAAVGPWQFIRETGERYGLRVKWWIDERRDFDKSTRAAAKYLKFLYRQFNAWHLAAAGYNAGENYILRLSRRHATSSFWTLSQAGSLNDETKNYVPKLIAATLIAKAPSLYGFRDLVWEEPMDHEFTYAPGGTTLADLADHLQITRQYLKEINPELVLGYIPQEIEGHFIRVPKGSLHQCQQFFRKAVALN